MEKKKCSGCSRMLPVEYYHKDKHTSDGLCCKCKECRSTVTGKILTCEHCGKMFNKYGRGRSPLFCPACKESETIPCKQCGEPIKVKDKRRFCNLSCAAKYNRKGETPTIYTLTCQECGITFERFSNGKNQKFCSVNCRGASQRTLKGTTRECIICGETFEPTHKEAKCCSRECQIMQSHKTLRKRIAISEREAPKKKCLLCGASYPDTAFNKRSIYCSSSCRYKAWAYKRRALINSVESELYSITEIYSRDNWLCQVCGKKVDIKIKWPDPKSPSIDHIIPISKGGNNKKDNVQLAHLGCNAAKGSKEIMPNKRGQLMFV